MRQLKSGLKKVLIATLITTLVPFVASAGTVTAAAKAAVTSNNKITLAEAKKPTNNLKLVWRDEFNGKKGELPDQNKWGYDLYSTATGWGNGSCSTIQIVQRMLPQMARVTYPFTQLRKTMRTRRYIRTFGNEG